MFLTKPKSSADASPDKMRAVRDALMLLALLRRFDILAWSRILFAYCELRGTTPAYMFYYRRARFQLHVDAEGETSTWGDAALAGFFSGVDSEPSSQFVDAAGRILAHRAPTYATLDDRLKVPIGVYVRFDDLSRRAAPFESLWRVLRGLHAKYDGWKIPVALTSSQVEGASSATVCECVLAVGPLGLHVTGHVDLPLRVMSVLEEMEADTYRLPISDVFIVPTLQDDAAVERCRDGAEGRTAVRKTPVCIRLPQQNAPKCLVRLGRYPTNRPSLDRFCPDADHRLSGVGAMGNAIGPGDAASSLAAPRVRVLLQARACAVVCGETPYVHPIHDRG